MALQQRGLPRINVEAPANGEDLALLHGAGLRCVEEQYNRRQLMVQTRIPRRPWPDTPLQQFDGRYAVLLPDSRSGTMAASAILIRPSVINVCFYRSTQAGSSVTGG